MRLMTTKQGIKGMETHLNNWFIVLIFFILIIGVEVSSNIPPEKEQTYRAAACA